MHVLPQGPAGAARQFLAGVPDHLGRYRVEGIQPGRFRVQAQIDHPQRTAEGDVTLAPGQGQAELDLTFEDGYTLSGVVRRQGEPVFCQVGLEGGGKRLGDSTDAAGAFRFSGLPAGEYRLQVQLGWQYRQTRELSIVTDREIVVEITAARVTGQLLGPYGDPAAGASVQLIPETLEERTRSPETTVRPDGRFELPLVQEGVYRLSARQGGAALVETVQVSGTEVDLGILQLTEQGVVVLAPRGPAGPLTGRFHVTFLDGHGRAILSTSEPTGADGLVRLSGVPEEAGSAVVRAFSSPGLAPAEVAVAQIEGGEGGEGGAAPIPVTLLPMAHLDLTVPLELGGDLRLTVLGQDGRPPLPNRLYEPPDMPVPPGGRSLALPPGRWTVTLTAGDGRTWSAEVALEPGQRSALRLGEP